MLLGCAAFQVGPSGPRSPGEMRAKPSFLTLTDQSVGGRDSLVAGFLTILWLVKETGEALRSCSWEGVRSGLSLGGLLQQGRGSDSLTLEEEAGRAVKGIRT